jgi:VanZ family protein
VWIGVALSLLAALDELHQLFIPGRDAEVSDWLADTVGATAGLAVGSRLMASRFAAWLR